MRKERKQKWIKLEQIIITIFFLVENHYYNLKYVFFFQIFSDSVWDKKVLNIHEGIEGFDLDRPELCYVPCDNAEGISLPPCVLP